MELPLWYPHGYEEEKLPFEDMTYFRRMLAANAHAFWWEWGIPCPCSATIEVGRRSRALQNHGPLDHCVKCDGAAFFYDEGQPSIGVISGYGEKGVVSQYMLRLQPGEMFVSLMPEHTVDMEDRFTDLMSTRVVSESQVVGAQNKWSLPPNIIRPRYPIARKKMRLAADGDINAYTDKEVGVAYMCKAGPTGVYVAGKYVEDTHFAITDEGYIDLTLSFDDPELGGPQVGDTISYRFFAHPVYKVKEIVRQSRDFITQFNENAGCDVDAVGTGPVFAIFVPDYRGFLKPTNAEYNPAASDG